MPADVIGFVARALAVGLTAVFSLRAAALTAGFFVRACVCFGSFKLCVRCGSVLPVMLLGAWRGFATVGGLALGRGFGFAAALNFGLTAVGFPPLIGKKSSNLSCLLKFSADGDGGATTFAAVAEGVVATITTSKDIAKNSRNMKFSQQV